MGPVSAVLQLLLTHHRALVLPSSDSGTSQPVSSLPLENVVCKLPEFIARVQRQNVSGESMDSVHRET